jgi:SAM-dependent methyltransferase
MPGDCHSRDAEPLNDFSCIADVYDQLVSWAPYEKWVKKLEQRMRRYGLGPGDWVLDAACGTGLSTLPWLQRGYRVVGVDRSGPMLRCAETRCREAGYEVQFLQQPLGSIRPGRKFPAAVCMHSGLDYILEDAQLAAAFANLRQCLRIGGLLGFDKCLDTPSFYRTDYSDTRRLPCGSATFHYRWDRTRAILEQRCLITRSNGATPRRTEVVYHLKATTPERLAEMAADSGFEIVEPVQPFEVDDPGMGIFRAV